MREITYHREGPIRTTAHQDAPIHLGRLLCLVDDDMPVRPVSVCSSAFGEFPGIAFDEAVSQVLGVQHVLGEKVILVVHQILAADHHVQHARCIRGLVAAFTFGTLVDGLVPAEHVHQLVE